MPKIITTSDLQKNIGKISEFIGKSWMIVTNRGRGSFVILPYFDNNDEWIEDYLEEYEMSLNREALKKRWKASAESGRSDLVI